MCRTVPSLEPGLQGHDDGLRTGGISGTLSVAFRNQASGDDIILYLYDGTPIVCYVNAAAIMSISDVIQNTG